MNIKSDQQALLLVKPDAHAQGLAQRIIDDIKGAGFQVDYQELRFPSRSFLAIHYYEHKNKSYFDDLLTFMASGPVTVAIVSHHNPEINVVTCLRNFIGEADTTDPATLRGFHRLPDRPQRENLVHASDSPEAAVREIRLWYAYRG